MREEFLFQHYLVVFFDHLGQRERLRKITGIPTNEKEKEKFIEITRESIGRVLQIRETFNNYFQSSTLYQPDSNLVPPEYRDEFLASQKCAELNFYGMSDAIIIAVPLKNDDDNCSAVNGIYQTLIAVCGIALLSLSYFKVSMRAGIDIGIATQIDEKEIYGPALESAYKLECNFAEYPRLLVGRELINYLFWVETRKCSTKIGLVAKEMAKFCRRMIIQDTDGRYMLDFLGKIIKESSDGAIDKNTVTLAFDFVVSQYEKYVKEENEKLASRYYRLLRYFHSRKKIWD